MSLIYRHMAIDIESSAKTDCITSGDRAADRRYFCRRPEETVRVKTLAYLYRDASV